MIYCPFYSRSCYIKPTNELLTSDLPAHLESAQDGSHPPLQAVPPLVPLVDHDFELAGGVGSVLPGQTAILFVDQLQLSQALVNLPLERLRGERSRRNMSSEKLSVRQCHIYFKVSL